MRWLSDRLWRLYRSHRLCRQIILTLKTKDLMPKTILFFLLLLASSALAQNTCPRGLVNDSLPGRCGLYTDTDGNKVCDLSETKAAPSGEDSSGNNVGSVKKEAPAKSPEPDDCCAEPAADQKPEPAPIPSRTNYHFGEIMIITGILGLATEFWLKNRSKDTLVLQTAWNWLLLLSFLGSALSGLYFVLPFDQRPALGFNFSYCHTVISIIFIAVAVYHTLRRFGCMLRGAKTCFKGKGEFPGGKAG